jgi:hypothetical protein
VGSLLCGFVCSMAALQYSFGNEKCNNLTILEGCRALAMFVTTVILEKCNNLTILEGCYALAMFVTTVILDIRAR